MGVIIINNKEKNLIEEINSLKKIVADLSAENEGLRKVTRDIRVAQMESVTSDMFVNVVSRLSSVEKKLVEIEEELSKLRKTKPVVVE